MDLYFLRHGSALGFSSSGRDEDRELSPEGKEQISALGKTMAKMNLSIDHILSSPFQRAVQTAERIAQELPKKPKPQKQDELASGSPTLATILQLVQKRKNARAILFIGHMPEFGQMIGKLLHTPYSWGLKAGTLCRLTLPPPFDGKSPATLSLYLSPQDSLLLGK